MFSLTKVITAPLLASALLCTSPLAAALKTKTTAPAPHSKISSARPSARSSKSASSTAARAGRHANGKIKVQAAKAAKPKFHGQQSIDSERTMEIQQALIREHYLDGEATGQWDQATRDALTRYQGDNHWQTKILPDSRALIKLGLGPSQQNLLNPESAAIAIPYRPGLDKTAPGGSN